MFNRTGSVLGGLAVAAMIAAGSVVAAPAAQAGPNYYGAKVYQAGNKNWKSGKNWNYGRHYNHGRYYNRGWNNNYWVGPAIGFGAGVLLGTALAQPRYYYPPAPRYRYAPAYYGNTDAYCASKYRSYNPYTKTYTGYDGRQHYCRIP